MFGNVVSQLMDGFGQSGAQDFFEFAQCLSPKDTLGVRPIELTAKCHDTSKIPNKTGPCQSPSHLADDLADMPIRALDLIDIADL